MSDNKTKMTVEEIKELREQNSMSKIAIKVCDTALTLHSENANLQAEVERLKRIWKMAHEYISDFTAAFIERKCGIPQDEKKVCPPRKYCPDCEGTGWCGDNGPGIKGNSEYNRCDCTIYRDEKKEGDDE
jgi:hypothetical protein